LGQRVGSTTGGMLRRWCYILRWMEVDVAVDVDVDVASGKGKGKAKAKGKGDMKFRVF